jgi:hypothetical protein
MSLRRHVHRRACTHGRVEFFQQPDSDGPPKLLATCAVCGAVLGIRAWPIAPASLPPWQPWEPAGKKGRQLLLPY